MNLRSVWRKSGALVLGAALVGSALFGAISVSAQAPTLPTLAVVTDVTDADGAVVTSGTVSAWVGTTMCDELAMGDMGTALVVGQTGQPAACTAAAVGSAVSFQVDGKSATATPAVTINPGVPQNVTLMVGAAMGDTAPADTTMGDTTMGDTTMGDTTMGDTTMGDTTMGDTTMGDTTMGDAAPAPAPAPTGNGGYLNGGSNSGLFGLALGFIALATVGGSLAVRRIRR